MKIWGQITGGGEAVWLVRQLRHFAEQGLAVESMGRTFVNYGVSAIGLELYRHFLSLEELAEGVFVHDAHVIKIDQILGH